jgi:hypothetical protein
MTVKANANQLSTISYFHTPQFGSYRAGIALPKLRRPSHVAGDRSASVMLVPANEDVNLNLLNLSLAGEAIAAGSAVTAPASTYTVGEKLAGTIIASEDDEDDEDEDDEFEDDEDDEEEDLDGEDDEEYEDEDGEYEEDEDLDEEDDEDYDDEDEDEDE